MRSSWFVLAAFFLSVSSVSCGATPSPVAPIQPWNASFDAVERADFNRLAVQLDLPLFWTEDANGNKTLDPAELAVLWSAETDTTEAVWFMGDSFTTDFRRAYATVVERKRKGPHFEGLDAAEIKRRQAVLRDLDAGRTTLVSSDFRNASAEDKALIEHVLAAAKIVERLHARQTGALALRPFVPADDPASRRLFYRNQGPQCEAPINADDPNCHATSKPPPLASGLYPESLVAEPNFCQTLAARPDARALLDPFAVVRAENNALKPVPYHVAFADDMRAAAQEIDAAAAAMTSPGETPFKTYLQAAAKAFRDGSWFAADEAWSRMNSDNSRWFLRIGPDETYFEPCNEKAGFHTSFARIDPGSLEWKKELEPIKQDLENAIAELAGPPYGAGKAKFQLPDFIAIIINAGESRSAFGATGGQSLPNFGPVANENRGRTMVMTNFYTDPDSLAAGRRQASSLFCASAMATYTEDSRPQLMSTVLHEAAHNLGPAHQYAVAGKIDTEIFGGPLASMLEELKAQSAALFYTDWLAEHQVITSENAQQAHIRDIAWAFGHIAQGMYDREKHPKPYSQLAAVQMGFLVDEGVLQWNATEKASNGTDTGCFAVKLEAFPVASKKLLQIVAQAKSRGDKAAAEALVAKYVDGAGPFAEMKKTMTERWLREPKASFVYSVRR